MSRSVNCQKLNKEAPALAFQTWPGELGKRVYENICAEAWEMWVNHQTMLINEYRLNPMDPKAKEMIVVEMEKFLFGEGSDLPADFVPKDD
ncbi:MAG: Fe-S cluster biosynthesis and repair protein YggX [Arenicella sp.]|jgi:Fe-S cluster biosynthesis and repair protein YggX